MHLNKHWNIPLSFGVDTNVRPKIVSKKQSSGYARQAVNFRFNLTVV